MIRTLTVSDPAKMTPAWWAKSFGKQTFEFEPGLNILWGGNGCGKSTLLKALGALTHCEQGGVPKVTRDSLSAARGMAGACELQWDRQPCYKTTSDGQPGLIGGYAGFDSDFMSAGLAQVMHASRLSEGQKRHFNFNNLLQGIPAGHASLDTSYIQSMIQSSQSRASEGDPSSHFQRRIEELEQDLEKLQATGEGQPTLILDEPTANLDLKARAEFWDLMVRQPKYQVIVATHDILASSLRPAHYIELGDVSRLSAQAYFYTFLSTQNKTFQRLFCVRHPGASRGWKVAAGRTAAYLSR